MLIGGVSVAGINFQAHLGRNIEKYLSGASFSSQLPHFSSKSKYLPRTILRSCGLAIRRSGLPYIHFPPPALCISSLALLGASLLFVFVLCLCLTNTIFSCICVCICSCICIKFSGPALCLSSLALLCRCSSGLCICIVFVFDKCVPFVFVFAAVFVSTSPAQLSALSYVPA